MSGQLIQITSTGCICMYQVALGRILRLSRMLQHFDSYPSIVMFTRIQCQLRPDLTRLCGPLPRYPCRSLSRPAALFFDFCTASAQPVDPAATWWAWLRLRRPLPCSMVRLGYERYHVRKWRRAVGFNYARCIVELSASADSHRCSSPTLSRDATGSSDRRSSLTVTFALIEVKESETLTPLFLT